MWTSTLKRAFPKALAKRLPLSPGRRAILTSIAVILPAALLIGMGLFAAARQRHAVQEMLALNRQLAGERLALQLERSTNLEAQRCFANAGIDGGLPSNQVCAYVQHAFVVDTGGDPSLLPTDPLERRFATDLRFLPRQALGHVQPLAYLSPPVQGYYSAIASSPEGQKLLVITLDLRRIAKDALDSAAYITGVRATVLPALPSGRQAPGTIHFPELFPFWQFRVEPDSPATHPLQDLLALSAMIAGTGLILLASIAVFTRNQWRQWDLATQRTRFVSGVSHELRMPLANIQIYADLLRTARSETETERFCDIISQQSQALARQFDEMMGFAQIESGQRRYTLTEADLREPVQDAIARSQPALRERGFQLALEVPDQPVLATFDRIAVVEAIYNLLENAIKYSGSRDVRLSLQRNHSKAILEVGDRGVGIPKQIQSRIFEPFYRGPGTAASGGFGLGLFLVHQTMHAHRGEVELISEPGRGATFRLRFPLP